jgi:hypothetical protein
MTSAFDNTPGETLVHLAEVHKPVVFLDTNEQYYPCDIEYLFAHGTYTRDGMPLYPKGAISPTTIPPTARKGDSIVIGRKYYSGPTLLDGVPMYGYPREVVLTNGRKAIQISYCFIYAYNGPKTIFGCIPVGEHQGDVEHITVELTWDTHQMTRVYFGAHKSDDGLWVDADDCEYTDSGQLIVYSANGSHASYPHSRDYNRCIGCADDITQRGIRWNGGLVIIDKTTQWNMWPGHLGTEPTPGHHSWWNYENETSTNWFCRMFCICR